MDEPLALALGVCIYLIGIEDWFPQHGLTGLDWNGKERNGMDYSTKIIIINESNRGKKSPSSLNFR
jgi:hypothetical protein